jgi:alpha-ketoglutarate-dependent taurine dioxygenase
MRVFDGANPLPLVIEPKAKGVDVVQWAQNNREVLDKLLATHGGLLFRGFDVNSVEKFEGLVRATSGELMHYTERSSPRHVISGRVYTSTDHPPHLDIFLHNEQSYNLRFPTRIFFYCEQAAPVGGATPVADTRRLFRRLSRATRTKFMEKKYMYVRNFGQGVGLDWGEAFQTQDKPAIERYCRENRIEFEWIAGNRLKTCQVREPVAVHPVSGELAWFNHTTFFHISTLPRAAADALLAELGEKGLPNNTYYGDGSPIESEVLEELRRAYLAEKVSFPWETGDVLMLDNILSSHGRDPFEGPRTVLVAMAGSMDWECVLPRDDSLPGWTDMHDPN